MPTLLEGKPVRWRSSKEENKKWSKIKKLVVQLFSQAHPKASHILISEAQKLCVWAMLACSSHNARVVHSPRPRAPRPMAKRASRPVSPSPRVLRRRGDWIVTRWVTPSRGLSTDIFVISNRFSIHRCECTWSVIVWCLCLCVFGCELRYIYIDFERKLLCCLSVQHFCLHFCWSKLYL